jgi:hypothetical protein
MKQKQMKNIADKPHGNVCEQMLEMTAAAIGSFPIAANQADLSSTDKSKAGFWAGLINPVLNRSAELLIEAGKLLIAAKKALPPGEWERMFELKVVHLHLREAQRLMQVVRNPVLSETNNCSFLPASPQALSALSQADPQALKQALKSGQITPFMTIAEAKTFLRKHPTTGKKTQRSGHPTGFDLNRTAAQCNDFLWDKYHKCPKPERDYLCDLLQDIVDEMKRKDDDEKPASKPPESAEG